ncbi:hypothetical protein SAMN04244573_02538 [Azotobacter beijerinckii]|uniref:Uncharacterized protein n=1 Tax=Azotobacter beijerinckii TaxID=170623 RepID=A0A1H9K1L5_9GAMM|nr:hypothetical protein SAMN04244573_02538 [Azotobacter beijerinckii]
MPAIISRSQALKPNIYFHHLFPIQRLEYALWIGNYKLHKKRGLGCKPLRIVFRHGYFFLLELILAWAASAHFLTMNAW